MSPWQICRAMRLSRTILYAPARWPFQCSSDVHLLLCLAALSTGNTSHFFPTCQSFRHLACAILQNIYDPPRAKGASQAALVLVGQDAVVIFVAQPPQFKDANAPEVTKLIEFL